MQFVFYISFFLVLSLLEGRALAQVLTPITQPSQERLPIDRDEPNIECVNLTERLLKYNEMARQHDQSVNAFLSEVTQKMNDWHSQLQPLEGRQQRLSPGVFSVLADGAAKISLVTDKAFDNSDMLANELDRIIVSLGTCVSGNK